MSFPAPHWKWRFLELWLIVSFYQPLDFIEPGREGEEVPAKVSSWAKPTDEKTRQDCYKGFS